MFKCLISQLYILGIEWQSYAPLISASWIFCVCTFIIFSETFDYAALGKLLYTHFVFKVLILIYLKNPIIRTYRIYRTVFELQLAFC